MLPSASLAPNQPIVPSQTCADYEEYGLRQGMLFPKDVRGYVWFENQRMLPPETYEECLEYEDRRVHDICKNQQALLTRRYDDYLGYEDRYETLFPSTHGYTTSGHRLPPSYARDSVHYMQGMPENTIGLPRSSYEGYVPYDNRYELTYPIAPQFVRPGLPSFPGQLHVTDGRTFQGMCTTTLQRTTVYIYIYILLSLLLSILVPTDIVPYIQFLQEML